MLGMSAKKALMVYMGMRPEEIAEREGLEVKETDALKSVDDVIISDTILLPKGLLTPQKRWRVAHCLVHHFMHEGNQVWCETCGGPFPPKQERQADFFAACLLTGREPETSWTPAELEAVKAGRLRR